ncbi:hypothetical protein F4821DRAFT_240148 [Hypoxylon rubiginosum]|uniref:Uncharacterized protein n=1 Tax=Hypoxylon rubiginosum TaxID=110542 RepID=A0ACC0CYN3_9PEZI|nr:hypothetical protein F4821DRAFT_240148 [Hypoxylon rubiginosum]
MVARKPLPDNSSADTSNAAPAVSIRSVRQELWSASDSDTESERVWARDGSTPAQTQRGDTNDSTLQGVPDALRPGTVPKNPSYSQDEENPWDDRERSAGIAAVTDSRVKPEEMPQALWPGGARFETNPFKRKPVQTGPTDPTDQTSQNNLNPPTTSTAAAPPPPLVPTPALSQLQIFDPETNTNPWQPALVEPGVRNAPHPAPPLPEQESKSNVWDSSVPSRLPSIGPTSNSPALIPVQNEGEAQPWVETPPKPSLQPMPQRSQEAEEIFDDQHAWDDVEPTNKGKQPDLRVSQAQPETVDGWNLIDHEPIQEPAPGTLSKQSTWENFIDAEDERSKEVVVPTTADTAADAPPALPPRRLSNENAAPPQPPRPRSPGTSSKSETYQIKNINWFDATAPKNPRRSPILVQNANGPCPLVALVNALSLTTPANQTNSNLVETLRSREQISLNFLLEAVFDELMSHRHTNPNVSLPDMTELYSFLKGLHTGMNVNPRFIPSPEVVHAHKRASQPLINPSNRQELIPGSFEDTRDMKLYATFSIPLIHGWLPPRDDPVYDSLSRQASSYDDVQSILFREEELEDKLSNSESGLTEQEQQLYQDIIIIKSFLTTSATQLTPWGLEVITKAVRPGTVSILFRNDHFSTLYRHPQTNRLFTLVTDAGYYSHDEVVWESLVDVRGEQTEFFSGDFRLVGGPQHQRSSGSPPGNSSGAWYADEGSSSNVRGGEWQTVQNKRSRDNRHGETGPSAPLSPKHEQEDRDLALALQLQEEEEERHRAEQAARRRESQLSEQFIEQQGHQATPPRAVQGRGNSISRVSSGPLPPARGSSANQSTSTLASGVRPVQQVRSLIPPASTTHRPADDAVDDAPPSYEQASKATPYVPPAGHPSHPESSPSSPVPRRRPTFPGQSSAGPSAPPRGRPGATPAGPAGAASAQAGGGKDKDCVVM